MSKKPGRGSDQFPLRLPPGMREQIKLSAETSGKSMNEEILDVLRDYFPEQPGFDEVVEQLDYTIALLETIKAEQVSNGLTSTDQVQIVLGRLDSANEHLRKIAGTKTPSVIKLEKEVAESFQKLLEEWELSFEGAVNGLANGLIQMSIDRVQRREESIRVAIGEGEARRIVELVPPWAEAPSVDAPEGDDVSS